MIPDLPIGGNQKRTTLSGIKSALTIKHCHMTPGLSAHQIDRRMVPWRAFCVQHIIIFTAHHQASLYTTTAGETSPRQGAKSRLHFRSMRISQPQNISPAHQRIKAG
jgi:hypothetical protein